MAFSTENLEKINLWFSILASLNSILPFRGILYNRSNKKFTRKF